MNLFKKNCDDAMIIVRYSGERTLEVCCGIIRNELPEIPLTVVEEYPFKKTLESCYRLALNQAGEKKWMITIDADMMIRGGEVKKMIEMAASMPDHYFQLQGRIADQITGMVKPGGPRCYRISLLEEALDILENQKIELRPEYHIIQQMANAGYPSRYNNQVICFHDYEQYYSDLFRKAFIHAKKHQELISQIRERAERLAGEVDDFKIILQGLETGMTADDQNAVIDSRNLKEEARHVMKRAGIEEKGGLTIEEFSWNHALSEWKNHPDMKTGRRSFYDDPDPLQDAKPAEKMKIVMERNGILHGFQILIIALINKVTAVLKS